MADHFDIPRSELRKYLDYGYPADPVQACIHLGKEFGLDFASIRWYVVQSGVGAIEIFK